MKDSISYFYFSTVFESYEDILNSIREEKAEAGVINVDIASYLQRDKMQDLVVLYVIERASPIRGVYEMPKSEYIQQANAMRDNFTCFNNFHQDIIGNAELEYLQPVKVRLF